MRNTIYDLSGEFDNDDYAINILIENNNPDFVKTKNRYLELVEIYRKDIDINGYAPVNNLIQPIVDELDKNIDIGTEESILKSLEMFIMLISSYHAEKYLSINYINYYKLIYDKILKLKKKNKIK